MIEFFVSGIPAPGGSKKGWYHKKLDRVIITDDAKNNAGWKQDVKVFARQAYRGEPLDCALFVVAVFYQTRPKSHYRTGKNAHLLKADAPLYPITKPDGTKLFRSTEDALTGIIWTDDARVIDQHVCKRYGSKPGALIRIWSMEEYERACKDGMFFPAAGSGVSDADIDALGI